MYGVKSHAAGLEIPRNEQIVARMASQRKTISINANPGLRNPKKITDQRVFKINWPMNIPMAIFTSLRSIPFFQIRNAATPMRKYNITQTGPKIHAGGEKAGLISPTYQFEIAEAVKTDPIMPASSETVIVIINLKTEAPFRNRRGRPVAADAVVVGVLPVLDHLAREARVLREGERQLVEAAPAGPVGVDLDGEGRREVEGEAEAGEVREVELGLHRHRRAERQGARHDGVELRVAGGDLGEARLAAVLDGDLAAVGQAPGEAVVRLVQQADVEAVALVEVAVEVDGGDVDHPLR